MGPRSLSVNLQSLSGWWRPNSLAVRMEFGGKELQVYKEINK